MTTALEKWVPKRFFRYLLDAEERGEHFAFLAGSGASRSCGIPTGGELVELWLPRIADHHGAEVQDGEALTDWAVANLNGYAKESPGAAYGAAVDALFPTPQSRRKEIDRLCRGRNPGFGYGVLAALMARKSGAFNVTLTTNFDDLLTDALYVFQGEHPLVIGEDRLADYIDPGSAQTLVVKLHGAYQMSPRNTGREIDHLDELLQQRVASLLIGRGLLVVGYGGNDPSVERLLRSLPETALPSGVWWVSREPPAPIFEDWLGSRTARWVCADDFDSLMFEAFAAFQLEPPNLGRVTSIFDSWADSYAELSKRPDDSSTSLGFQEARRAVAERPEGSWQNEFSALAAIGAEQRPDERRRMYLEAVERFPQSGRIRVSFGRFLASLKPPELDEAQRMFERAITSAPTDAAILGSYANFLGYDRNDRDAAQAMYKRALDADPTHAINLANYALFLMNDGGDPNLADVMYRRALDADPNDADTLGNYATFLTDRGDRDSAEAMFDRALAADPNDADTLGNYAIFLENQRHDPDAAEAMYLRALASDPEHANNLCNYATLLSTERNDLDAAEAMYGRALEVDPNHASTLRNYAIFLENQRRDPDAAEAMYERALRADDNRTTNLVSYANFLARTRADLDAAEALYTRAIEIDPHDPGLRGNYAAFLAEDRKDLDAAEATYARALDAFPSNADLLGSYALFLDDDRKDRDAAVAMYKRALEADPENANNLANYSRVLFANGETEHAEQIARRVLSIPESQQVHLEIQLYRWAAGAADHRDEAKAEVLRLLDAGVRSPGWSFEPVLRVARSAGRDDLEELEEATARAVPG